MEEWLSAVKVAKMLDVTPQTIREWSNKGIFIPDRVLPSGTRRYSLTQVERFLKEGVRNGNSTESRDS